MKIDRNILTRYFLGEAGEAEKSAIHQWLDSDEANRKQFIRERIRFDASLMVDENKLQRSHRAGSRTIALNLLKVAAALLILVGSGYLFSLYFAQQQQPVMQSIYVPAGNRTSLTLPDGTLVWLNSNTTLTYPNIFTRKERNVELNGEAYFEVTPDTEKQFIVSTDKYQVEVLGTTFNIEAYAGKQDFETALFSGKVKLYKENEKEEALFLQPGQLARLAGKALEVKAIDRDNYRWRDGLIIIEDKSFEEIMQVFEKYYGQQIIIENEKVKSQGYRGKLRIADGVDHALRVLQNDVRFTYKRDEDASRIYIY